MSRCFTGRLVAALSPVLASAQGADARQGKPAVIVLRGVRLIDTAAGHGDLSGFSPYLRFERFSGIADGVDAIGRAQRENFQKAVRAGVKVAYGTDAGVYPHGWNGKQFAHMVRWGMTPVQAIRSATVNAAELLGWSDRVGRIARLLGRHDRRRRRPAAGRHAARDGQLRDERRPGRRPQVGGRPAPVNRRSLQWACS